MVKYWEQEVGALKLHFDDGMKKKIVTYVSVAIITVIIFFSFYNMEALKGFVSHLISLLSPFILGFGIAFILNKPMMLIETKVLKNWNIKQGHKRTIAAISALIIGIGAVTLFFCLLIPQLISSVVSLVDSFPKYVKDFQVFLDWQEE